LTAQEKQADLHFLQTVIHAGYGPLDYKIRNGIVDVAALDARFEQEVAQTQTNQEFHYKLVEYVAAYKDGHFGVTVPSNKVYVLPITTDLINGKVLITLINRTQLPQLDFAEGDEIVSVDGLPISTYLDQASRYISSGVPGSIRRLAAWTVFSRRATRLPAPPHAQLTVEIRKALDGNLSTATLNWQVRGEDPEDGLMSKFSGLHRSDVRYDQLENSLVRDYAHGTMADSSYACSGKSRIALPEGAVSIMDEPFVAYYYPTPKGNVGYLRIPHYSPAMFEGGDNDKWVAWYEYAIQRLEANTVGLIIDQDHNCGGSVGIVNFMISMFMDRPFQPVQFELLANKQTYMDFKEWTEELPRFTNEYENVQAVLALIKGEWLKGSNRLTPKTAIDGKNTLPPNSIRYTKPVVMLIDEISGSGGDAFPAMMKGLGRAKLFGQNTSGLGGHVLEYPVGLPNSEVKFRITKSLFYNPQGVAIENNGATPDQFYTITRHDILNGFAHYRKAYTDYLLQQVP